MTDEQHKTIRAAFEELRKSMVMPDALEQKGIGEDWVCCMNPQTYADIERQIKEKQGPYPENSVLGSIDQVAMLVRRQVFVFDAIAYGRLEYMPFVQAYARWLMIDGSDTRCFGGSLTPIDDSTGDAP